MISQMVIVVRDMINIADENIKSFCSIEIYIADELIDCETVSWNHLENSEFLGAVL